VIGPIIVAAGFLLALRIGYATNYWTGVLPAMIVIAVGMAGASPLPFHGGCRGKSPRQKKPRA
jgi:hypothetical protein